MHRALLLRQSIFAGICVLILGQSPTLLSGQTKETATIQGQLMFRSGKPGSLSEYSNPSRTYIVYFTEKGTEKGIEKGIEKRPCQCSDCNDKCHCCIPQFTATTNKDGEFKALLPPGKYLIQVQLNDKTWKVIEVELKKAGQSQDVEIKLEHPEPR